MYKDPFQKQRSKKAGSRLKIHDALSKENLTFGQLEEKAVLSHPVLSLHLKEMTQDGLVASEVKEINKKRRIVFFLTDKAKGQELMRRELLTNQVEAIRKLIERYSGKNMSELAAFAKEEPELFQKVSQWVIDYMAFMMSDEALRWLNDHGNYSMTLLQKEITKKLTPTFASNDFVSAPPDMKLMLILQNMLNATQQVVLGK